MEGVQEREQPGHEDGRTEQQKVQDGLLQREKGNPPRPPKFPGQLQSNPSIRTIQLHPQAHQLFRFPNDIRRRLETWHEEILLQTQTDVNRHFECVTHQQEQTGYKTDLPTEVTYRNHCEKELEYLYGLNAREHRNFTAAHANSGSKVHETQHRQATRHERVHAQNGLRFPQQSGSQFAPIWTLQAGQNQEHLYFTQYPDIDICPMGRLPYDACQWRGEYYYRQEHIVRYHAAQLVYSNRTTLPANRAIILTAYKEHFLCYTVTVKQPDKLYCVVQHANKSSRRKCVTSYQYRCEISAANRYEKITETRLVGNNDDDFVTLVKQGRCVRWDAEVVKHFVGNDAIDVSFKISIAEKI
jgi:hypothetical protein